MFVLGGKFKKKLKSGFMSYFFLGGGGY